MCHDYFIEVMNLLYLITLSLILSLLEGIKLILNLPWKLCVRHNSQLIAPKDIPFETSQTFEYVTLLLLNMLPYLVGMSNVVMVKWNEYLGLSNIITEIVMSE